MFNHKPRLARSRRQLSKINKRMKRMRIEITVLTILVISYFAMKIVTNAFIFHPVTALADTDLTVITIEKPVQVIKEVEVDRKFTSEKQQIMAYLVEKFGDRAGDAITIINQCENHAFNPNAINHNHNGTVDIGVMQINVDPSNTAEVEKLHDWKYNIDRGYAKYKSAGNKFTAWTCATVIGEKNYLNK